MNDEEIRPEERILPDEQPRAKRRLKRSIRETVWMLAISVAVVVVIRLFVFELAIVEGPSMEPTLYTNNRVLVMKWTALFNRIPKYGEVVVTKYPGYDTYFIKRCIGVPGDRIKIVEGIPYINGVKDKFGHGLIATMNQEEVEVPEGYIYVLGDNRSVSIDSHQIGNISLDKVFGRADYVMFPLNEMKKLSSQIPENDPRP